MIQNLKFDLTEGPLSVFSANYDLLRRFFAVNYGGFQTIRSD